MIGIAAISFLCLVLFFYYYYKSSKNRFRINGKTVLITGASSGIGRGTYDSLKRRKRNVSSSMNIYTDMALCLSSRGVRKVVLWDLDLEGLDELKQNIEAMNGGVEVSVRRVDVSIPAEVANAAKNVQVDVLINNAGIVTGKYLLDMTENEIRRTMNTNGLAHFWTVRSFLPYMLKRGNECAVITISSLMGQMTGVKLTDYCASKHAANGFHESLRLELRALAERSNRSVVHTMLVCPYVIDTGMFDGAFEGSGKPWFMRLGLFPKLKSRYVATQIIHHLESRSHLVVLPWYFRYVPPVLHVLPASCMDWIEEFAGARVGMKEFRGRKSGKSD